MTPRRKKAGAIAGLTAALALTLSACGSDSDSNEESAPSPTPETSQTTAMAGAASQTFGEGCSLVPTDGDGSFDGMATAPVATAASANPLLKTLVKAVGEADLVDTLNSAEDITVFAPTDDAFAKVDSKALDALLADKDELTNVLTHHVVEGQLSPEDVAGEHKTLAGDTLTVEGADEMFTVGKESAKVLCGNIPTANATVYVVDTVLMP